MEKKGKFIVFEGTDGSGKSTQLKMLAKYLSQQNIPVYTTAEPTDSPFGAQLRACLTGRIQTNEHTIATLFAADRLDHIFNQTNGIIKKLNEGVTVLCDRYYFSSLAYNGGFVPSEWVFELNRPAMQTLKADLTIFIDLSAQEGMARVSRRGETDRYETMEKQERIHARYLELFKNAEEGENIRFVKSLENKEDTQRSIREIVNELFGL